jgi:hypothetical protein
MEDVLMHSNGDKWLTLSEVVHQSNFEKSEARRIVESFGKFLGSRNFGDIVKYPPAVGKAIGLISNLYAQGWGTEEIKEILTPLDQDDESSSYNQLQQELGNLINQQNQALNLMQSTFELVQGLMSDIVLLTEQLAAADEAMHKLKAENQVLQSRLVANADPGK